MKSEQNLARIAQDQQVTSLELRDLVNEAREAEGEPLIRNNQFIARVIDELDIDESTYNSVVGQKLNSRGTYSDYVELTADQALLVGMRESKGVRKKVLEWLRTVEKELMLRLKHERQDALMQAKESEHKGHREALEARAEYYRLRDMRLMHYPKSDQRFNVMDVFAEELEVCAPDGSTVMYGQVGNIGVTTCVRHHRGRTFMDEQTLQQMFGLSMPQLKKLTTREERCTVEGRLLLDLDRMPKPLTGLL